MLKSYWPELCYIAVSIAKEVWEMQYSSQAHALNEIGRSFTMENVRLNTEETLTVYVTQSQT